MDGRCTPARARVMIPTGAGGGVAMTEGEEDGDTEGVAGTNGVDADGVDADGADTDSADTDGIDVEMCSVNLGGAAGPRRGELREGRRCRSRCRQNTLLKWKKQLIKVNMPGGDHTMRDRIVAAVTLGVS